MSSPINEKLRPKRGKTRILDAIAENGVFRVRERDFSLKSRAIRLSEVFRARRKVVLRGKGNAWVLDLRSFEKIREVGDLSYLVLHFV